MRARTLLLIGLCLGGTPAFTQDSDPAVGFRRGNESATRSKWDDALAEYESLNQAHVRSPAIYWNWGQVAAAKGAKGEALWAMLRAQDLSPSDGTTTREIDRFRSELGLDPSEVSLGMAGEFRLLARRFRFDIIAIFAFLASIVLSLGSKPRPQAASVGFILGILLGLPLLAGRWSEPRGVVIHKDAPLVDAPRADAVALSNLREGEVVPILAEEGEYVRVQDASGARGFAHRSDVRKIGMD